MNRFQHNILMATQLLLCGGRVRAVNPGYLIEHKSLVAFADCSWHGDSGG